MLKNRVLLSLITIALLSYSNIASARYLQSDPIGLQGGMNTFAYAEGNPISKFDPNGQSALSIGAAAARLCALNWTACQAVGGALAYSACKASGGCVSPVSSSPDACPPDKTDKPKCYFERQVYYGGIEKTCIYKQRGSFGLINVRQYANKPCPPIDPDTCWVDKTGTPEEDRYPPTHPYE